MTDHDDLITAAFADFTAAAAPSVHSAGAGAVRMTVKHRRTVHLMTLSVLAVLLVITPVAAYAITAHGGSSPPVQPAASSSPSPSATPSPSTSATPSTTPSTSGPTSHAPRIPDGRISVGQLTAGKVTVPSWPSEPQCPSGRVRLIKTTNPINGDTSLYIAKVYKVVHVNLDDDSSLETAALMECQIGETAIGQVVGFDRDLSGHIVTLGQIAKGWLWDLTANPAGGVTVALSDSVSCCATPKLMELHQQRVYAWNGAAFVQTGGPRSFISHTKPNTFKVVVKSATYASPHGAVTPSTIVVTITNTGAYNSAQLLVSNSQAAAKLGPGTKFAPGLKPGASETVSLSIDWDTEWFAAGGYIYAYEMGSASIDGKAVYVTLDAPKP